MYFFIIEKSLIVFYIINILNLLIAVFIFFRMFSLEVLYIIPISFMLLPSPVFNQ